MTRYIIIGAGAIGGTLAARMTEYGVPVVAIARGAHGDAIERSGLTLHSPDGTVTVRPEVARSPSDVRLTRSDVLVLAVKTQQAGTALAEWADVRVHDDTGRDVGAAGDLLPIVTALNGVHADTLALRYFGTVVAACVLLPAVYLQPGEVVVRVAPISGGFVLGSPGRAVDGGPDSRGSTEEAIDAIKRDWTRATFDILSVPSVMEWKYTKLVSNLANAPQALVGPDADGLADIVDLAQGEATRVLDAVGVRRLDDAGRVRMRKFISQVRPVPSRPDDVGGSTWQSLTRGTSLESDYLNGEIVSAAHRAGLRAPVNATLARLARTASAAGRRPGDLSVADVRKAIDATVQSTGAPAESPVAD